jgi:hypothetical protein
VYRDLYLGRAQTLLSPVMSLEDFHRIEQQQAMLAELPLAVARALDQREQPPASALLKKLELSTRRGLTREAIERALLMHGTRVLEEELGLDPRVFRLVCIPSDVHFRLGEAEGWGRQPCWTHFDGYLIRTVEGRPRLQALVGGDVRYGGLYDLVGVRRDYDSDRLIARFAVVHRERMVVW